MSAVVDTDVFSFVFKQDSRMSVYKPHLDGRFLFLSFMSLAELELWALVGKWGQTKKSQLAASIKRYSIYHSSPDLARRWAETVHISRRAGRPISAADAWIAATALHLDVPLITHNASDYEGVKGLTIISEGPN